MFAVLMLLLAPDSSAFFAKAEEMRAAQKDWNECTSSTAKTMAVKSKEPATDIVSASFGVCSLHEQGMRRAAREALALSGADGAQIEASIDRAKADKRELLLAVVIAARAK